MSQQRETGKDAAADQRATGVFFEMDTAEAGLIWVEAEDEEDAANLTGTWATGYAPTGRRRVATAPKEQP